MHTRPLLLTLVLCLTAPSLAMSALAQQQPAPQSPARPERKSFSIKPSTSPIVIDGELSEGAWANATPVPLLYEWQPGDNVPASIETTCLVTFDEERLYIACRAKDPNPSEIRAHYADRDVPFLDDTVGFMIDTFNDRRRGYQFRVNPRGVQMEAINSDVDGSEDWSWDAIWDAEGRVTDDGYVVEIAVPFSSLRFPRTVGTQTWGFMASRDWPRSMRHASHAPAVLAVSLQLQDQPADGAARRLFRQPGRPAGGRPDDAAGTHRLGTGGSNVLPEDRLRLGDVEARGHAALLARTHRGDRRERRGK